MTDQLQLLLMSIALVFCRVGGSFIMMPGIGSARIPMPVRLLFAVAISLAAAQLVMSMLPPAAARVDAVVLTALLFNETAIGVTLGLMVRMFTIALQFAAAAIVNVVGLTTPPQPGVEDQEPSTPFSDLVVLTTLTMMFALGLHLEVFEAVIDSYSALPPVDGMPASLAIGELVRAARASFSLAIEIGAPFIVYSLAVNALLAVANRWVPQIPVMFIATPIIIAGALLIAYTSLPALLDKFTQVFIAWAQGM